MHMHSGKDTHNTVPNTHRPTLYPHMLTGRNMGVCRNTQHACAHTLSISYIHIHRPCNVWTFAILVGGVPTDQSQRACYRLLAIAWISVVTGSKRNQILPLPSFQEGATRPWVIAVWPGEAIAWNSSQVGEPHAYSSSLLPCPGVRQRDRRNRALGSRWERVKLKRSRDQELAGWNSPKLPGGDKGEEVRRARPLWSLPTVPAYMFPALGQGVCIGTSKGN